MRKSKLGDLKMKCPKCQFENREDAAFCLECGEKIELECPQCGKILSYLAKFCDKCGHDLRESKEAPPTDYGQPQSYTPKHLADKILTTRSSIEGERKLVTVLFADVADFTAISERLDPEEVHQIMDGCFKILMGEIHKFEGTINQFTGDGVMALFGAPVAHEDHVQRACYASLSIQSALENYTEKIKENHDVDFKMRIGLNSGTVVVASIGDDLRMDYTAVGDTTNLAARMESRAEPGSILVSGATHKLVKYFFEFKPLGKLEVKGKEKPQDAYELIKAGEIETRIGASIFKGLTKFVGRKNSMAALKEPYERVLSGSGQVVGIVGEAGVGKSRLLLEFINQLPRYEYTYFEGRCLHYGSDMAYLPMIEISRSYFGIKEGDQEVAIKDKLEEKIRQLDQRLEGTLPAFQELLSLRVDDEKYLQLDPGEKKVRIFEAIRDLFIRESEQKPLVLAIEDLHWIDKTSEECIGYLIDWLANKGILLILLYRLEYTHQWGSKSYYTKIGLTQLGSDSCSQLVQAIVEGGEVVPEIQELVLGRSGGNPLFVEELTHNLLENGTIQKKNYQYLLTRNASDIHVPDTIQGIIAARIDRIEDSLKRVIQVASVIGREFAFRILQAIMGMEKELKSYLLSLQGFEFIAEKRLFPELDYIFKHSLTQEVAYNSLLQKKRKEIHEKIGQAIESLYPDRIEEYFELLAYHYARSDDASKALNYLDRANQKSAKLNAMEEAKVYFEEAMKLLDAQPETDLLQQRRISLLVNQWIVFWLLFRVPEYFELLKEHEPIAVKVADPQLLAGFYSRLGMCEWISGSLEESITTLTKAAEICEDSENVEELSFRNMYLIWNHLYKGDYDQAIAFKNVVVRLMEQKFNLRTYTWSLCGISWAYSCLSRYDEALNQAHKTLKVSEEYLNNGLISFAAFIISIAHLYKGEYDRSIKYGDLAVQKAPTIAEKVWAQTFYGWSLCRAGKVRQGVELLASLVPMYGATGFLPGEIILTLHLCEGYWLSGEYGKARQTLEEVLPLAERCGMKLYIAWAHRLLGEVALKTDAAEAARHFEKSIAIHREIKVENELALAYAGYGRLFKQQGNIEQARDYLSKALEIFERLGTLIEPDKVRKDLAELPGC